MLVLRWRRWQCLHVGTMVRSCVELLVVPGQSWLVAGGRHEGRTMYRLMGNLKLDTRDCWQRVTRRCCYLEVCRSGNLDNGRFCTQAQYRQAGRRSNMAAGCGSYETVGSAHRDANRCRRLPKSSRSVLKEIASGKWLPSPRSRKWPYSSSTVRSDGGAASIK